MQRLIKELEPMLDYLKAFASTSFAWLMVAFSHVNIIAFLAIVVTVLNVVVLIKKINLQNSELKLQNLEIKIKQIRYDKECQSNKLGEE